MRRLLTAFCMAAICLMFAVGVIAQDNPTGTLVGTVTDPQGASVKGAKITITDQAMGKSVTAVSGDAGEFSVANLAPANYSVTIEMAGFKRAQFSNVTIIVGKVNNLPAKLDLGDASVTVEVNTGGEQLIETQTATVNTTITGRAIIDLPMNSRSTILLGILDPSAETAGGSRNTLFEGLPGGAINITVDGINVQDQVLKSSDAFFAVQDPRVDDVQEFGITTASNNPSQTGEGSVHMTYVSKGGSNAFHGGVWEYNRNTDYNANSFFNNLNGVPRQTLQLNDYGFKLGGPFWKDRLFFFVDLDDVALPFGIPRQRSILTPAAAGGVFTFQPTVNNPATVPGESCVNGTTQNPGLCTLNLYSFAGSGGFPNSLNSVVGNFLTPVEAAANVAGVTISPVAPSLFQQQINFNSKGISHSYVPDGRVDFNINKAHSLELDYHYSHVSSSPDVLNGRDALFPGTFFAGDEGTQLSNRNLLVAAWRWAISSNMNNELRLGVNSAPINFGIGINNSLFPTIGTNFGAQKYTFGITGVSNFLQPLGAVQGRNSAFGQLIDNFSWVKGAHSLTFGFSGTSIYYNDFFQANSSVTFGVDPNDPISALFSNIQNINSTDLSNAENLYASLTGRVNSFSGNTFFSPATGQLSATAPQLDKWRQYEFGIYAADSWRIKPTLTFNYGLRWEYSGAPWDTLNEYFQLQNGVADLFGPSGNGHLFEPGLIDGPSNQFYVNDKGKSWYDPYYHAFAPSVGFAWQPHSESRLLTPLLGAPGKTVFRAGYNIAYNREGLAGFSSIAGGNPGYFGAQSAQASNVNDQANGLFQAGSVIIGPNASINQVQQSPNAFVNEFPVSIFSGNSLNAFDPHIHPPMIQSWSAGIQRELYGDNVLEIRYQANHGAGLWDQFNLNEVNIFENGFLNEFNNAAGNLNLCVNNSAACLAAEQDLGIRSQTATTPLNDFADLFDAANAVCSGPTPPPSCGKSIAALGGDVMLPIFTGAFTGAQTGPQTGSLFRNGTVVTQLQQGQAGALANVLQSASGGAFYFNLLNAGFPSNFFVANPNASLFGAGSFVMANGAQSTYNALVVDFRRRPSHGLQFDLSYTYAKALTNYTAGTSGNAAINFNQFTTLRNLNFDKGPAPFDIRNAIKGQMIYELPFGAGRKWSFSNGVVNRVIGGWSLNTITRWQSGTPINITSGLGSGFGGTFNQFDSTVSLQGLTPNQLQKMLGVSSTAQPGAVLFFPTSLLNPVTGQANASAISPCQTAGSLCSKLYVYGPGFFKSDWSLGKSTKITERVNLETTLHALNLFNNANFYYGCGVGANPCSISTQSTQFGRIAGDYSDFNSTQDPGGRTLELIVRVNF